ncbi:protein sidekick-2-like [Gracilinanus agilis]|uniref:protein sidekick-2-like n=1 Tax=Gracilinanus agilis TaxID=191870 RepID=UPI001CFD4158|nr:protein sidekick-2-like [Gracilinanus agilis]
MGSFEEGEKHQSVSHGEAAVIKAPRISSFPQPQVTWFRDGRKIPPSSRIAITLDNTLVILSTVAPDAGRYYVQAVNDKNGDNKTSQPITLTVENVGGPADPIAPTIIIPPKNTSVVAGTSEVTMECVANARSVVMPSIPSFPNLIIDLPHFLCSPSCIAPNITRGPLDSTVIDGMSVVLACETSGAPRPAITWQKGERILASGSIQLPRFTLLESGSLLISPTRISDAGSYTCLATNSRGVDEASADLIVWARTRITMAPQDQSVIKGTKAFMTCGVTHDPSVSVRYVWEKDGAILGVDSTPRMRLDKNGSLHISQTWSGDIGTYTCRVLSAGGNDSRSAYLRVRQLPHAPEHPVATLSTAERRSINLTWAKPFDGNSPLIHYVLEMSENNAPWTVLLPSVDPEATSVMVKGLVPARSYQFRLCAVNDVGKGQFSKDTERVSLPEEPPTAPPQNVIASGRTNQSIMIQWQPPPESHQNGILKGYIIRFCLAGLPVGYQFRNITNADVNNLLLEELIIWTNYEISVAAYNSAGLGVYSSKVTEWTLQGVPTVPPGNVRAEAINSTTIRFTWNAPSPQFINGINQGYKLIAWEPEQEEEVTMVTARPNFQDSIHVGFVSGLKKFTEYFTSVLCFTTPGDGPRSLPQLVRTHEDVPGPVGHLSFNEILDTSLKVSWQEPGERNGILTGYRISWEEYNRTNTRVTHYLPNVTLEYRVTGLTALTTYTIEVAAMTSKGQGQVSASTISSGVPPGTWMEALVTCFSALQIHKAGRDNNMMDDRIRIRKAPNGFEQWAKINKIKYNDDNEVNIVGTSPPSQPSRKIQTLQAPPDMAPGNVTLRTASETSLWLRWMPLPEMEYNGNPESVGYKIKYTRSDGHGKTLSHVVHDRIEREYTIEDLEEWTEYRVQVQAFNAIGTGPWSQIVVGRTRESVPSSGPTNVSALATTSSSMLVRWNEIPEADRNGLVLGYKVVYKEKDSDTQPQFWLVEGNSSLSAQLTGLGRYVLYEIQVLAFTRIGDGTPSSPPILERTLDDVPGPPMGILFPEVRPTSVRLIWQPPAAPNGIILAYQITHRLNTTTANTASVEVLTPSARQYTATGLKPESIYLFRIMAQTRKGWGEAAEALVVTTEKRDRPQPPSKPVIKQENVKARSVLLSWEPGSDGLSPVRYYTIQTRELPSGKWALHSSSVTHNATSFVVDRLKPFTSYKFRVKSTNDIGDSEYSEESESLTTLQAAPEEAPTILSVTPHTTTSVLISWQPPAEDKINGILLGFRIRYRELLYEGLRGFTMRNINNPSTKWAELTSMYAVRNLSRPSLTQYELDNLSKHKRYEIRMSVYNAVGEGPSSSPQEVFVGEAVPTAPPQNVAVHGATATQLDVTWEPPPLEAQNGDIQGYKVLPRRGAVCFQSTCSPSLWRGAFPFLPATSLHPRTLGGPHRFGGAELIQGPALTDVGHDSFQRQPLPSGHVGPPNEGLWDILIKDIPKEVTSYTFSMDILKHGVSYDFRVIAVNDYGYGTPSSPSQSVPAQKANPFYEEWWFLVVIALVGLIFILLLVFVLIIRGQSKKYAKKSDSGNNAKSSALGHGEMVSLDESSFPALELNNRRLSVKNSFCRKNGIYTRSPPRPSPGSLHYSDEDVTKYNDLIPAESSSLTEKPSEISDSQGSDSEYEVDQNHQKAHSFVNHYISDPTYYNSWRRQQKGISRAQAYSYTESDSGEPDHSTVANNNSTQQGSLFRPKASRTPTPQNPANPPSQQSTLYRPPSSLAPGSRAPIAGFSSFV